MGGAARLQEGRDHVSPVVLTILREFPYFYSQRGMVACFLHVTGGLMLRTPSATISRWP